MVPCFICGKDATGGFIHGFVPAPDSQKVGLCPQHDTLENKKKAILHWIIAMKADVANQNALNAVRLKAPLRYTLSIRYSDGGVVSIPCLSWDITDSNTLQITRLDRTLSFVPLHHVRQFDVTEDAGAAGQEASDRRTASPKDGSGN
ncbi:hypothetical protein [Desulfovibrio psychrotolerans]|uniref:Uncharacterized protein n=1 Tax=Desulfovibrio psychrotolerans TaxID=415242 RepID=A0A7J0BP17_9BACT|nr:hypothetical protein [Desulfovibrio psychrotolerans]GFM35436.1 hypothetical protein DSM19430T_01200 [Desulfovibrio psychrotolerans]